MLAFLGGQAALQPSPQGSQTTGRGRGRQGKWTRLREPGRGPPWQEKALVFTQFREITARFRGFPRQCVRQPWACAAWRHRCEEAKELVERFQQDASVPFFVLSPAGGSGTQPDGGVA